MRKTLLIFLFFPILGFSQAFFAHKLLSISDTKKKISNVGFQENILVGFYINENILFGISTEDAVADYIDEGYSPVQDSLIISSEQIFIRYYLKNDFFIYTKSPFNSRVADISPFERNRFGVGYIFYRKSNFDFEIGYDALLNKNDNEFRKGAWNLSFSYRVLDK